MSCTPPLSPSAPPPTPRARTPAASGVAKLRKAYDEAARRIIRHDPSQSGSVLTPPLLLAAYCQGLFPMARSRFDRAVKWYSPDPRAILPLDRFRCPRSLRQTLRKNLYEIRRDTAFNLVIRGCAGPRAREHDTWINPLIVEAYAELHRLGFAHSVEAWRDGELVGGLYGVALGGAFFGESMFHDPHRGTDASKACLAHLVEHLRERGFALLDTQINNPHMQQFGTIDVPRKTYLAKLEVALAIEAKF